MIFAHFTMSARMMASNSAGVLPTAVAPSPASAGAMSGERMIFTNA